MTVPPVVASLPPDETRNRLIRAVMPDLGAEALARFNEALRQPTEALVRAAARILEKPYGRNHILSESADHGISFVVMLPGRSTSVHVHGTRRELFCVRRGTLTLFKADRRIDLHPYQCEWSTPGEPHALANEAAGVLEVLELFAPPLLDDKIRLSDRYDRKLGAVTHRE